MTLNKRAEIGKILMISAGLIRPKKSGNPFSDLHLYLNYGLLGLATILKQKGYYPTVIHGNFKAPAEFVNNLEKSGHLETTFPVLLSVPSSYAIEWAKDVCLLIKKLKPDTAIVVGGRWVTADDGAWIRQQIPDVDLVVFGTAEHMIEEVLNKSMWSQLGNTDVSRITNAVAPSVLSYLDYSLLENYADFTPSFEVSRGCGRGCGFCAEGEMPLSSMKDPSILSDEIEACLRVYGEKDVRAYFEASFFRPSSDWISGIAKQFTERGIAIQWRAESRVDALSTHQVERMAKAGLKVLDLGLESASPKQLVRMNKTTAPAVYLRRASELLKACHEHGIWVKVNVLLYPGETQETLSETQAWLEQHRQYIKGVSAGPMIMYRYGHASLDFLHQIEHLGARAVSDRNLDTKGFADIHLSDEFSNQDATFAANKLARNFMSAQDYYDLKSFSYFPRSLTFEKFNEMTFGVPEDMLSFRISTL